MFGQMLPGSEPRPSEDLDWHSSPRFRQSGIFADIQPWNIEKIWMEVCNSGTWFNEPESTDTWTEEPTTPDSWINQSDANIDLSRC